MEKISKAQMSTLPKIIAVDFDGTLVTDCYPEIGVKDETMFRLLLDLQAAGVKLILWTCRHIHFLDTAVEFCASHGLVFDAVNRNIDEVIEMFNNDGRKVYADWYLDDKNADLSCLELFALLEKLETEAI